VKIFALGKVSISYDTDAQAFFTAVEGAGGSLTLTEKTALNNLCVDFKDSSLWSKFIAIYPFAGGSAASHKYNLKDPRDLDAAYRITFNGTITHSSTGANPNGSSGTYGHTHLVPNVALSLNSVHISYYSRETTTKTNSVEFGQWTNPSNGSLFIAPRFSGSDNYSGVNSAVGGPFADAINSQGYFVVTRTTSVGNYQYKNGVQTRVFANNSGNLGLNPLYIFAMAEGAGATNMYNSDRECAFASVGSGLTAAEVATLNRIVEEYEDALSRGVE
jgi:hypothetical protein